MELKEETKISHSIIFTFESIINFIKLNINKDDYSKCLLLIDFDEVLVTTNFTTNNEVRSINKQLYFLMCPYSISVLNEIYKMDIKIYIITARYDEDKENIKSVLKSFNFPIFDIICCGGFKKSKKVRDNIDLNKYEYVFGIDDMYENLKSYHKLPIKHIYTFLFTELKNIEVN